VARSSNSVARTDAKKKRVKASVLVSGSSSSRPTSSHGWGAGTPTTACAVYSGASMVLSRCEHGPVSLKLPLDSTNRAAYRLVKLVMALRVTVRSVVHRRSAADGGLKCGIGGSESAQWAVGGRRTPAGRPPVEFHAVEWQGNTCGPMVGANVGGRYVYPRRWVS
jgi:hypothetical protein